MKNENVPTAELSETTTAPTVEEVNSHEKALVNRRLFMRHSLVAGAAATVGAGILANSNFAVAQGASGKLTKGDVAILQFLAAAEIALAVESLAKSTGAADTVGTTGICDIFPRAVNSIPSRARMEIDVRDINGRRRDSVLVQIEASARKIAARRKVTVQKEVLNADPPAECDPSVIGALEQACASHYATCQRMISRAYHDSLFMSLVAPTAMLFIPCRGGVSHRPDEYSSPGQVAKGALVLAEALALLSK